MKYADRYGFLHIGQGPEPEQTENPLLFTAQNYLMHIHLFGLSGEIPEEVDRLNDLVYANGQFRPTAISKETSISHDNFAGWGSLLRRLEHRLKIKFSLRWIMPWDIALYLAIRYKWKRVPWPTRQQALFSINHVDLAKNGRIETDRALVALCTALGFSDDAYLHQLTRAVTQTRRPAIAGRPKGWAWGSWKAVFLYYFQDPEHPNVKLAESLDLAMSNKNIYPSGHSTY